MSSSPVYLALSSTVKYAVNRTVCSIEEAIRGKPGQPIYPNDDSYLSHDLDFAVEEYGDLAKECGMETQEAVEKFLKEGKTDEAVIVMYNFNQILVEIVEKAKEMAIYIKKQYDEQKKREVERQEQEVQRLKDTIEKYKMNESELIERYKERAAMVQRLIGVIDNIIKRNSVKYEKKKEKVRELKKKFAECKEEVERLKKKLLEEGNSVEKLADFVEEEFDKLNELEEAKDELDEGGYDIPRFYQ